MTEDATVLWVLELHMVYTVSPSDYSDSLTEPRPNKISGVALGQGL